jgi:RNA polymerase-binding transcription factor DksA
MKATDKDKYRKILTALASRIRADTVNMREQARSSSGGNGGPELSNAPLHLGDMGTEEFLYDMNVTLLANEQYIVGEARAALARLGNDFYGKCESCGRAIATARLEAIPYTRFCVECAAKNDTPQVNINECRPMTPADTLAPEGEMDEDRMPRTDPMEAPVGRKRHGDVHAAGTAGGGTAVGGLAGGNQGNGDPVVMELDEATGSGNFDVDDDRADDRTPQSGFTGGAVGGTPARKRAK